MSCFVVSLKAEAWATYQVEAKSHKEAYELVIEKIAQLSDAEASDWDIAFPGIVESIETNENFSINQLLKE